MTPKDAGDENAGVNDGGLHRAPGATRSRLWTSPVSGNAGPLRSVAGVFRWFVFRAPLRGGSITHPCPSRIHLAARRAPAPRDGTSPAEKPFGVSPLTS